MNEVKPDAGTPPLFYCKPVNDKGGPCHAPDCHHRSSCMLQMKRQQHSKDGKTVVSQEDDNSSRSWTSVRRKKRRSQPKINDETQDYAQICRDCSSKFVLSEDTKTWFIERQLHLPVRCSSCRHERKAKAQQDERHPSPPKVVVYPQNIRSSQTAWSNPAAQRSTARSSIHPSNNICSNDKLEKPHVASIDINQDRDLTTNQGKNEPKLTTASRKGIDEAAEGADAALIRDLLTNNTNDDSSPESREGSPERRKSSQPD